MIDIKGKHAVITGISKGIGRALAKKLLDNGVTVTGWGQSEPDYKHENLRFIKTNVRDQHSVNHAAEQTLATGNVDYLINNAGLGYFNFLEKMPDEQITQMLETNINGVIYCTKALIGNMKANETGHVINLSSTAGIEGMPQVAVYCATKWAVRGFTEALFKEVRNFGIKVTAVYPGAIATNFFDNTPGMEPHAGMLDVNEVADQLITLMQQSPNFCTNHLVFRPLQPKKYAKG
ncbi:MAG: SDR family oxidoreductase [Bacteroidetes bacterium]|nr:SDR family oxidoreductase [Bacteroidota bacterium]